MTGHSYQHSVEAALRLNAQVLSTQSTRALLRLIASAYAALCLRVARGTQGAYRRYTTRDELRELDARSLRDIGLTKAAVATETSKWFWQE